jgi:RND family efflux transporter MFP subunit
LLGGIESFTTNLIDRVHKDAMPGPPHQESSSKENRPVGRRWRWIAAGVLVISAIIGAVGWWVMRPPDVLVLAIKTKPVEIALSVVGRVRPDQLVDVRSRNAGQIIQLLHDEGDVVAAGAPLAIVRSTVEQAQTQAEGARVQAAQAELNRARLLFERTQALAKRGFATRAALEEARAAMLTAEAALTAASATRRAAAERVGEFTIRAPMAGVVLVRPIDNGQIVSPETTLFQMGSGRAIELRAEADEAYADALRPGMTARAALTGSDTVFAARITEVSPRVDPITGGRAIRLRPVGGGQMPAGRSVDITIIVTRRDAGIVIPRQAVINATAAPTAYIVDADGFVRKRSITLADWPSQDAIVESGLVEGDRVVLNPAETAPASRVRPRSVASE